MKSHHEKTSAPATGSTKQKFKLIFVPFVVLMISMLLGYTFLRWLFDIRLGILPLRQEFLQMWIPIVLALVLALLLLRRRIALFDLEGERTNGYFFYQLIAGGLIALPVVLAQVYIEKAGFPLIEVSTPDEIDVHHTGRYYSIGKYDIDSLSTGGIVSNVDMSRGKDDANVRLYLAFPLKVSRLDSFALPPIWYCRSFHQRFPDNLSESELRDKLNAFVEQPYADFAKTDFHAASYFLNLPYSLDRIGYEGGILERGSLPEGMQLLLLEPQEGDFSHRTGSRLGWIFGSALICALVFWVMCWIPKVRPAELQRFLERKPMEEDGLAEFLEFLTPKADHFVTSLMIDLNLLVFLAMALTGSNLFYPSVKDLFLWGGSERQLVLDGGYWRLLASTFVHGGFMHLAMNMVALAIGGMAVERILGRWRLALLYLFSGLAASTASIVWHAETVSVGASGAIFGVFGGLLALLITGIIPKMEKQIYWYLLIAYGLVSMVLGFVSKGTDNAAHIGGFVCGFAIGLVFVLLSRQRLTANAQ